MMMIMTVIIQNEKFLFLGAVINSSHGNCNQSGNRREFLYLLVYSLITYSVFIFMFIFGANSSSM